MKKTMKDALKNSLKNHEISSAFTKKSIEGNSIFDNFFYKLPGLLGSSYTDIKQVFFKQFYKFVLSVSSRSCIYPDFPV